jgi:putative phosphoesterase
VSFATEDLYATTPVIGDESSRLRIGLISDTHIPEARRDLWPQVFDAFADVDAILHGGDIHALRVIDQLEELAPTFSARGNGEDGSGGRLVAPQDPRLRPTWVLQLGVLRVGIIHDLPIPEFPPHMTVANTLRRQFGIEPDGPDALDVIVHGDSHVERIDLIGPMLCINPGSPVYPHNLATKLGTIGFLDIEGRSVRASLCQLTEDGYEVAGTEEFVLPVRR